MSLPPDWWISANSNEGYNPLVYDVKMRFVQLGAGKTHISSEMARQAVPLYCASHE